MSEIGLILAAVLVLIAVLLLLWAAITPVPSVYISYNNEPNPNCPDCGGLGIIHPGHEHFECDCPCTTRYY